MSDETAVKLIQIELMSRANAEKIEKLEHTVSSLNRIVTSTEVMETKVSGITGQMQRLELKVSELEAKPGRRWENIVEKIIWAVVGAVIMLLLAKLGI